MKHYILYNPLAGNNSCESHISELTNALSGECILTDMTKLPGYSELFAKISEGDDIVILGGDGTLNRFINDIDGTLPDCPVLYFPAGTGNDFLRDVEGEDGTRPFDVRKYLETDKELMSTLETLVREKVKNAEDSGEAVLSDDDFEIEDFDEEL